MYRPLIRLIVLAVTVTACSGGSDSKSGDPACQGSGGGNLSLSERAEMQYAVEFRQDSGGNPVGRIEAVIVGRGGPGWKTRTSTTDSASRGSAADSTPLATRGTIGAVRVGYDRRANVAVIGDQRIALDSFNVILIDNVDSAAPRIGQRLRVAPEFRLASGACAGGARPDQLTYLDSIRGRLMRSPEVRAFAFP